MRSLRSNRGVNSYKVTFKRKSRPSWKGLTESRKLLKRERMNF